jgi:hypothetical protein
MSRIALALMSLAVFLAVACGGGDKNDGGILGGGGSSSGGATSNDPNTFARQALVTFLGVFSGNTDAQKMLDLYLPSCRTNVKASDLTQVLTMVKAFFPELSKVKVEDIDLGQTKVEKNGSEVKLTVQDPSKVRVKVDGKFISADEYAKRVGFDDISDSPLEGVEEPLLLKEEGGRLYISECSDLEDLSDSGMSSSGPTPTPQRGSASPTPQRTTTAGGPTATPGRTATQVVIGNPTSTPQRGTTPTGQAIVRTTPTAAQRYPANVEKNFMDGCVSGGNASQCRCMFDIIQVRYNIDAFAQLERDLARNQRINELDAIAQVCVR